MLLTRFGAEAGPETSEPKRVGRFGINSRTALEANVSHFSATRPDMIAPALPP